MNLMLLRHGKSDWDAGTPDDFSRPLAPRGVRSAERMGEVLRDLELVPDLVISSTATRARSTAELARITGGWDSRLVLEDRLYGASVVDTLSVAEDLGADHDRVMLVGHEPTWSLTVHHITGARVAMRTATCVDMELDTVRWTNLMATGGALVTLLQPRHFLRS